MKAAVSIPVTVKCRIGVDDQDPEAALDALTASRDARPASMPWSSMPARPGCRGSRPRRTVRSRRSTTSAPIVSRRPIPTLIGRASTAASAHPRRMAAGHLAHLDGVMLGREAYQNPEVLLRGRPAALRRGRAGPGRLRYAGGARAAISRAHLERPAGGLHAFIAPSRRACFPGRPRLAPVPPPSRRALRRGRRCRPRPICALRLLMSSATAPPSDAACGDMTNG